MATIKELEAQLIELKEVVSLQGEAIEALKEALANVPKSGRDRGPVSQGEMTEEHAIRVMIGDLRNMSHKQAALELKLSYGQIYSARKGYTFKPVYQRMIKGEVIDTPFEDAEEIVPETTAEETQAAE